MVIKWETSHLGKNKYIKYMKLAYNFSLLLYQSIKQEAQ